MIEIISSIFFSLFEGSIIDTKLNHHKYEKRTIKKFLFKK